MPSVSSSTAHTATASTISNAAATGTQARFDIEVQTESDELRDFLLRHIELQRFRELPDLDDSELSRLVDQVPDNLGDLLGTLGHFNPVVAVQALPSGGEVTAPLGRKLGSSLVSLLSFTPRTTVRSAPSLAGALNTTRLAPAARCES